MIPGETKIPIIKGQNAYSKKFFDRSPQCIPAGMLKCLGDSVEQSLHPKDDQPPSPDVIRKFRSSFNPDIGRMKVFYGTAYDPHRQWAVEMNHGITINPPISGKEIMYPEPKTLFQERLNDRTERIYQRHKRGPLGKSHKQASGLPESLDLNSFTFGLPTPKDVTAGVLIHPPKNFEEVVKEACDSHEQYIRSHADYYPMERVCRSYTSPHFHPQKRFGKPTPHCNEGKQTKEALKWLYEIQNDLGTKIVNKHLEDYREKYQPQIGKGLDVMKDTRMVSSDHTFGALHKPDPYGAGEVIHYRNIDNILKGKESHRATVAAVRQQLKKLNYLHFNNLLDAFRFYDQSGKGKITLSNLCDVCVKYNLPLDMETIENVLDYCDVDLDGLINYQEFCNFLNWKDKLPTGLDNLGASPVIVGPDGKIPEDLNQNPPAKLIDEKDLIPKTSQTTEVTVRHLEKQVDNNVGNHSVSSSRYNAVVGPGGIPTRAFRTYGVPTIRSDLPAPTLKQLRDRKNYGDEAEMCGLIYPSLYSQHGVYERDLLQPRTFDEIQAIFTNIGVRMTGNDMEKAYKMVASKHPKGNVSVESFKNFLDDIQVQKIKAGIHPLALGKAHPAQSDEP